MRLVFLCLSALSAWCAVDVTGHARWGSVLTIELDNQKRTEIEWISTTGVRIRPNATSEPRLTTGAVVFTVEDGAERIIAKTRDLALEIRKKPFEIRFVPGDDVVDFRWSDDGSAEFGIVSGERFYGLGIREDPSLDLRGRILKTDQPLLLSSRSYGLYLPLPGSYEFDVGRTKADILRVRGETPVFYFYSAGEMKGVLEQHHRRQHDFFEFSRADVTGVLDVKPDYAFVLPRELQSVCGILHGSLSGLRIPAVTVKDALAPLMPIVLVDGDAQLSEAGLAQRKSLETHFVTYLQEANDRGLPVVHPLALQFPYDPAAAGRTDEFMLGDELLVATAGEVYLPQGYWTELKSGIQYRGKRSIKLASNGPWTLLARNGAIMPLDRPFGMELHYFPKLGGEYLIVEPELGLLTQVHAGPSAEALRLEIEEKVGREYEWVIHHVSRPTKIMRGEDEVPATYWNYDSREHLLRVRVRAEATDDVIVNVTFEREDWYFAP